jgi:hypothetical protein
LGFGRSAARTSDTDAGFPVKTCDAGVYLRDPHSISITATLIEYLPRRTSRGAQRRASGYSDAQGISRAGAPITSGSPRRNTAHSVSDRFRLADAANVVSVPIWALRDRRRAVHRCPEAVIARSIDP